MRQSPLIFGRTYRGIDSGFRSTLLLIILATMWSPWVAAQSSAQSGYDIVAVGDIMLGRMVEREMRLSGLDPWHLVRQQFPASPIRFANFEASVTNNSLPCQVKTELCLSVSADRLTYIKQAGFTHLSIANNHTADLGAIGRQLTKQSLQQEGMTVIDARHGLQFGEANGLKLAFLALSLVADVSGYSDRIPSLKTKQQLQLARQLADKVIVSIHWGNEYQNWVSQQQREAALWLTEQGADLILGHHPHVIQTPECVNGRAVWFSLGNHVFDQKYPSTQQGALAACRFSRETDTVSCDIYQSERNANSAAIQKLTQNSVQNSLGDPEPSSLSCGGMKTKSIPVFHATHTQTAGEYLLKATNAGGPSKPITNAIPLRKIEAISLGKLNSAWLMLLELESSFDQQKALRPHVYKLQDQRLIPLWRGSALAYPILDVSVQTATGTDEGSDYLCVLHEAKSHLSKVPLEEKSRIILSYQWSKFGFKIDPKISHNERCQQIWPDLNLQ